MVARTAARHARQRARKLERKDEDVQWMLQQRMRICQLCKHGYIANSREEPDRLRVRRWHGVEVCRACEKLRIPTLHTLVKMGLVEFRKKHRTKVKRTKGDPDVFVKAYGGDETWQPCEVCRLRYKKVDLRWRGVMICYGCLKAIRLVPQCIKLGIFKEVK